MEMTKNEKRVNPCPKCGSASVSIRAYAGANLIAFICCECKHEGTVQPELAAALRVWNGGEDGGKEDALFE